MAVSEPAVTGGVYKNTSKNVVQVEIDPNTAVVILPNETKKLSTSDMQNATIKDLINKGVLYET